MNINDHCDLQVAARKGSAAGSESTKGPAIAPQTRFSRSQIEPCIKFLGDLKATEVSSSIISLTSTANTLLECGDAVIFVVPHSETLE